MFEVAGMFGAHPGSGINMQIYIEICEEICVPKGAQIENRDNQMIIS